MHRCIEDDRRPTCTQGCAAVGADAFPAPWQRSRSLQASASDRLQGPRRRTAVRPRLAMVGAIDVGTNTAATMLLYVPGDPRAPSASPASQTSASLGQACARVLLTAFGPPSRAHVGLMLRSLHFSLLPICSHDDPSTSAPGPAPFPASAARRLPIDTGPGLLSSPKHCGVCTAAFASKWVGRLSCGGACQSMRSGTGPEPPAIPSC